MPGEVFGSQGYLAETDVGLIPWWRVVYHVPHRKGVVICPIHQSLGLLLFLTQTVWVMSPLCYIPQH